LALILKGADRKIKARKYVSIRVSRVEPKRGKEGIDVRTRAMLGTPKKEEAASRKRSVA
jgi:hypothetical protein